MNSPHLTEDGRLPPPPTEIREKERILLSPLLFDIMLEVQLEQLGKKKKSKVSELERKK